MKKNVQLWFMILVLSVTVLGVYACTGGDKGNQAPVNGGDPIISGNSAPIPDVTGSWLNVNALDTGGSTVGKITQLSMNIATESNIGATGGTGAITGSIANKDPNNPFTFNLADGSTIAGDDGSSKNLHLVFNLDGGSACGQGSLVIDANMNATSGNGTFLVAYPSNASCDSNGSVLFARTNTAIIANTIQVGTQPTGIAFDAPGNAWITNFGSSNVSKLSPTGTVLGTFPTGTNPHGVAIDSAGNAWVANFGSNNVVVLSPTGTILATYPVGIGPRGLKIDSQGNVWVANYGGGNGNTVTKLSSTGALLGTFTVGNGPFHLRIDATDNVWVVNYGKQGALGNTVTKLDPSGAVIGTFTVGLGPHNINIDSSGNVWVVNSSGNTVTELSSSGAVLNTYPIGFESRGIDFDNGGNVWIASFGNNASPGSTIVVLKPDGTLSDVVPSGSNGPAGVNKDPQGNMWVTNYMSGTVTIFSTGTNP